MIALKRLYRLRFFHLLTAIFASPASVIAPEFEHCLAKMIDDVFAVEVNVFDQRPAIFAVENDMLFFTRRPTPLYDQSNRVWRALGRVRHIGRNEECFALANNVINNRVAFADTHLNVTFELIEILFRINQMEIVPRVGAFDNHDKKIAPIVKIPVTHRRFEFIGVLCDPLLYINWRLHSGHKHDRISACIDRQTHSVELSLTVLPERLETRRFSEAATRPIKTDFRVE